ncbi:MAG TPA: hypothetical protein EYQ54_09925 [Myxococcales bacterium]|nr:hypothetical protein [Myxococcales bacterium]HIL81469.1 hypothetical protein [Myxococcales bacterium]
MRRVMLAMGIITGMLVLGALALDEGEIVTLYTEGAGRQYSTQLWIVEIDGREFVRANRPSARWLARLRINPAVSLRRAETPHGSSELYWARPIDDEGLRGRVDAEIARKYRFADKTWGRFADRAQTKLIELEPRPVSRGDSASPSPPVESNSQGASGDPS